MFPINAFFFLMKKSKNDAKLQGDNHRLLHGLLLCPTSTFKSRNNSPDITKSYVHGEK